MKIFSLIIGIIAGLTSFLYMSVFLPNVDFPKVDWMGFSGIWFIWMWAMSLAWVPLLVVHLFHKRMSQQTVNVASIALALVVALFFAAVYAASFLRIGM